MSSTFYRAGEALGIYIVSWGAPMMGAPYKPPYIIYYFVKGCNLFDGYESL